MSKEYFYSKNLIWVPDSGDKKPRGPISLLLLGHSRTSVMW